MGAFTPVSESPRSARAARALLEACDDLRVGVGDVARLAGIAADVVKREADRFDAVAMAAGDAADAGVLDRLRLHVGVAGGLAGAAGLGGDREVVVRHVQFPIAEAHGVEFVAGVNQNSSRPFAPGAPKSRGETSPPSRFTSGSFAPMSYASVT